jgi:A/G-specific adenine glycosylase
MSVWQHEKIEINEKLSTEIALKVTKWGSKNYRNYPWRNTDNIFHALIAEVMLQRTRADQVEPIYIRFTEICPTIEVASTKDPSIILDHLKSLGFRRRNERILLLIPELNRIGGVPATYEGLIALSGVGQYSASALLSLHMDIRKSIIDSNVIRLWSRVFGFEAHVEIRRKKWFIDLVDLLTPKKSFKAYNYAVLDLTGKVCKTKPLCIQCPLNQICRFRKEIE